MLRRARAKPTRRRTVRLVLTAVCVAVAVAATTATAGAQPQGGLWVFTGAGWGHGIGMSQYGALGFAQSGAGYADILRHYYRGTSVTRSPGVVPGVVRVGILPSRNPVHLTGNGRFEFVHQGQVIAAGQANESWQVSNDGDRFTLKNNGNPVASGVGGPASHLYVRYQPLGTRIYVAESRHWYAYGTLEFNIVAGGGMRSVIEIPSMDQYLYGLGEVPSSWHVEALRAQAVAARTYAAEKIRRLGQNRAGCNCGLHASTLDQAYIGYDKEAADPQGRWRSAVDATSGVVVLSGSEPIQAFYSSSSGGATENNENVWGGGPVAYLRGVPDEGDLRTSPFIGWRAQFTQSDIDSRLNSSDTTSVGSLQRLDVIDPVGVSRRVTPVRGDGSGGVALVGSGGTKRVSGDRIRSALGLRSTMFQLGPLAYDGRFTGGVHVAAGDLSGDGVRVVSGAGAGGGPHVKVMRPDGTTVRDWFAYAPDFRGGVAVAVGDVTGDGRMEVVTAPQSGGGPHIRVWRHDGARIAEFFAFDPGFFGGVSVAVANGDIVVGAGPGWEPRVRTFSHTGQMRHEWNAYGAAFRGGVHVAGGRINSGTPTDEIVTGAGPGGGPHVRVFDPAGRVLGQWFAYNDGFRGGVHVAAADLTGNGEAEVITGPGAGGGPHVRAFRGNASVVRNFFATTTSFAGGVRVAGYRGGLVTGFGPGWWPLYRIWP